MIGTRACGLVAAVALTSLLCACATSQVSSQGNRARGTTAQPIGSPASVDRPDFSSSPIIVDGRFTKPFELDNGALTVLPLSASYRPVRNIETVAAQAWTTQWAGQRAGLVGLGRVTISKTYKGAAPVKNLVAWVALADRLGAVWSCPLRTTSTPPAPKLPSPSESAVVIGDAKGSAAVVFTSTSFYCGEVAPATAVDASELISAPWVYRDGKVSVKLPQCSSFYSDGFSSTRTSTTFDYSVKQLEAPAFSNSMVPRSGCAPARWVVLHDSMSQGVNANTRHQFTAGPVLTMVPCVLPETGRSPVQDLKNTIAVMPKKLVTCSWHPSAK